MKKILTLMILNACAPIPSYVSKHGLKVVDKTTINTPHKNSIEDVTNFVTKHLGEPKHLEGYTLYLFNMWIEIPQPDDTVILADGYADPINRVMIVSVFQTCFADSSFLHELAHAIHDTQVPDWDHEDLEFWKRVRVLSAKVIEDLCPEGYVHQDIPPDYTPNKK